ncbi:hypothetical protein [Celeribacter baekdonensis]|uniref:hypothetical protein n=1 Tax=Celeribacter baekdonensis TaxID=875171 RepID=UPI003A8D8F6E
MKRLRLLSVAGMMCAFLSGCETIKDEFGVSEGFVSRQADRFIVAQDQHQRADRYLLATLLIAPLALDTVQDETDADTALLRLNALYGTLADLYTAIGECQTSAAAASPTCASTADASWDFDAEAIPKDGYSFETLSYEVQSDLYFLGKSALINLDLDDKVKDLAALNPTALVSLYKELNSYGPALRRGAATYRDGIVIYTDAVFYETCQTSPNNTSPNGVGCKAYKDRYATQKQLDATEAEGSTRGLTRALSQAQNQSKTVGWSLNKRQALAVIAHVDVACTRAARISSDESQTAQTCFESSNGRKRFLGALERRWTAAAP